MSEVASSPRGTSTDRNAADERRRGGRVTEPITPEDRELAAELVDAHPLYPEVQLDLAAQG